ncbi:amidohydrolase family protein [Haliea sp. E17]|uniref:amidohydrolase family protein n=1 Tax=Haliea sp. E17 TaxID=3401576 RepID=UPI003AAF8F25
MTEATLIRNAELYGSGTLADVRLAGGVIDRIGSALPAGPGDSVVDARGAALLPGLHDHHIHLVSLAAALQSLSCGPPTVANAQQLAAALRAANQEAGDWLRGIGYHPAVAGDIDRHWLDRHIPDRPCRIQHRGGRLWVLNSRALAELGLLATGARPPGLELRDGEATGRLYEEDLWLRRQLRSRIPDIGVASHLLASYGITGLTDTTPHNGVEEWRFFGAQQNNGSLLQGVRMMGTTDIAGCEETDALQRGELKIHLLESQLPEFGELCRAIEAAHRSGRGVAVHCVTLAELVFTLGAFESVGSIAGDRIEHASVTPDEQLAQIRALGLRVVTQPHFIAERGDQYLAEVDPRDQPWLYRCAGFRNAGIPLAAGSDAAFGQADPWAAMRAAVERRTPSGRVLGATEALSPEQALALFLSPADAPGVSVRKVEAGALADLCLLDRNWGLARETLRHTLVRAVWRAGQLIHGQNALNGQVD